jgi:hypothetical protein
VSRAGIVSVPVFSAENSLDFQCTRLSNAAWRTKGHLEARLKTYLSILILVVAAGGAVVAAAGNAESGFFLGAGVNILTMDGTGEWSGFDFSIDAPLNTSEGGAVGLNWSDKLLFGAKPMVGYRFSPDFALQADLSYFAPKTNSQTFTVSDQGYTYTQRMDMEWNQRNFALIGLIHPMAEKSIFLFGGVEFVSIEANVTFSEGLDFEWWDGEWDTASDAQSTSTDIDAVGYLLGGGLETPPGDKNVSTFVYVQYSTAITDDSFFGTRDFKVKVGGFSAAIGFKWYLSGE